MARFRHHIFICTNQRGPEDARGCCDPDGSEALRNRFKEEVARSGLKRTVRANSAGCLDQCEHGPTVVIYPEAVWYGNVRVDDVAEIVQSHLVRGKPVERLLIPDGCINEPCAHLRRAKKGTACGRVALCSWPSERSASPGAEASGVISSGAGATSSTSPAPA